PSARLVDEPVKKAGRGLAVFHVSPVARPTPRRHMVPSASLAMLINSYREAAREANVGLQPNGLHTIANPARQPRPTGLLHSFANFPCVPARQVTLGGDENDVVL
ncbi:unnamed protein product, partial [Ectocarpus sp. 12 AP-2014]